MTQFRVEVQTETYMTLQRRSSLYQRLKDLQTRGDIAEVMALVPLSGEVFDAEAADRLVVKTADRPYDEGWEIANAIGRLGGVQEVLQIDIVLAAPRLRS